MKVSPLRFRKLLEWSTAGGLIEVAKWEFEDQFKMAQADQASLVAVLINAKKEFFTKYKKLGTVVIDVAELEKAIRKCFRDDADIEIKVSDNRLILEGQHERIERNLFSAEVREVTAEIEETEFGLLPKDTEYDRVVVADAAEFKSLPKADYYTIDYDDKGMKVSVFSDNGVYQKKIKIVHTKKLSENPDGSVAVNADYFRKLVGSFNGPITFLYGENKPIILSQKTSEYIVTYALTPMVIE